MIFNNSYAKDKTPKSAVRNGINVSSELLTRRGHAV